MTDSDVNININPAQIEAVPVTLDPESLSAIRGAAEFTPVFAAWQTVTLLGVAGEKQAQQVLPADLKRIRAYIACRGAATGFILVGQYGQVQNGQGGKIFGGDPRWEIRAHSALWFAGDGATPLNFTVYVERDQGE